MFKNKKLTFCVLTLSVALVLGIVGTVMSMNYLDKVQTRYNSCVETSAEILINDGNTPSREVMTIAKESCVDYLDKSNNPVNPLYYIAITLIFACFVCGFAIMVEEK